MIIEALLLWLLVSPFILGYGDKAAFAYRRTMHPKYAVVIILTMILGWPGIVYSFITKLAMLLHGINLNMYK